MFFKKNNKPKKEKIKKEKHILEKTTHESLDDLLEDLAEELEDCLSDSKDHIGQLFHDDDDD